MVTMKISISTTILHSRLEFPVFKILKNPKCIRNNSIRYFNDQKKYRSASSLHAILRKRIEESNRNEKNNLSILEKIEFLKISNKQNVKKWIDYNSAWYLREISLCIVTWRRKTEPYLNHIKFLINSNNPFFTSSLWINCLYLYQNKKMLCIYYVLNYIRVFM